MQIEEKTKYILNFLYGDAIRPSLIITARVGMAYLKMKLSTNTMERTVSVRLISR